MPLGTITIADRAYQHGGKILMLSFAGDDAYPAGGTLTFAALVEAAVAGAAAAAVDHHVRGPEDLAILAVEGAGGCGQYVPWYDAATDALQVLDGGTATWTEVVAATDLSGITFHVKVTCK